MSLINLYCFKVNGECIFPFVATLIMNLHYMLAITLVIGIIVYYNKKPKIPFEN